MNIDIIIGKIFVSVSVGMVAICVIGACTVDHDRIQRLCRYGLTGCGAICALLFIYGIWSH